MLEDAVWLVTPSGQRADGGWVDDVLVERAAEAGLEWRYPDAGRFPRERIEVLRGQTDREIDRLYYRRGWTDGLPIVPPTQARVRAMLRRAGLSGETELGAAEPLFGRVTLEKAAANAVMAGCDAAHFPVVRAALDAALDPAFNLRGVQTTDENVAPLLILSGPDLERIDVFGGCGALGPGWRGNMVIGRAVRLALQNLGGGWPGAVSLAGLGQPGRLWLVLAEAPSPWPNLRARRGYGDGDTLLTVLRAEAAVTVTGKIDDLGNVMRSSLSAFSRLHGGHCAVIVAPYVAQALAREGWSEADVRRRLWELSRADMDDFRRSWIVDELKPRTGLAPWAAADLAAGVGPPAVESPDHIVLIVAGADAAIPQHAYFPTWGFPEARIEKTVKRIDREPI